MSAELTRFLAHVYRADRDATLADAAEVMDTFSDASIAVICRAEPGAPICLYDPKLWKPALRWSCELRGRLWMELAELELDREDAGDSEGCLRKVLKCVA